MSLTFIDTGPSLTVNVRRSEASGQIMTDRGTTAASSAERVGCALTRPFCRAQARAFGGDPHEFRRDHARPLAQYRCAIGRRHRSRVSVRSGTRDARQRSGRGGASEPGGIDERTGLVAHDTYPGDGGTQSATPGGGLGAAIPNLPTAESALAYPGTCLFEGTNVSEGRGTVRPFETVGAGWIDSRLAAALRERELPGMLFREAFFVPSFDKWAGQQVRGLRLHIVDRLAFEPLETGVTILGILAGLYPAELRIASSRRGGRETIHRPALGQQCAALTG